MQYSEGDDVLVFERLNRGVKREPGTIVKVGRTLVTIEYGGSYKIADQFRIDTQRINNKYGHKWFKTPEQVAEDSRRTAAWNIIKECGLERRFDTRTDEDLSTELLEDLAVLLLRHKEKQ